MRTGKIKKEKEKKEKKWHSYQLLLPRRSKMTRFGNLDQVWQLFSVFNLLHPFLLISETEFSCFHSPMNRFTLP
jgi:hypothetical protein